MLAITIDAGNEVVSVLIVFFCCYGLAAMLHGAITIVRQGREYEQTRRRNLKLQNIDVRDTIE